MDPHDIAERDARMEAKRALALSSGPSPSSTGVKRPLDVNSDPKPSRKRGPTVLLVRPPAQASVHDQQTLADFHPQDIPISEDSDNELADLDLEYAAALDGNVD